MREAEDLTGILFEIKYDEDIKEKLLEILTHTSYVNTVPSSVA